MDSTDSLEKLLAWLSKDGNDGSLQYEEVRRNLIYLFTCRGCRLPEELADETIDRTARAIGKPDFRFEGNPIAFFRGVAHNVHLEWLREDRRRSREPLAEIDASVSPNPVGIAEEEVLFSCLEDCLEKLPARKREFLLRYYGNERKGKIDERQRMADERQIGLNALRIQIFRLRNTVRGCVQRCATRNEI